MLTLNRQHVDPGMSDCSEALLCTPSPCSLARLLCQPLPQTQFSAGSHQLFTSVLWEHCAEACAAHVVPTLVLLPLAVGAHGLIDTAQPETSYLIDSQRLQGLMVVVKVLRCTLRNEERLFPLSSRLIYPTT